MSDDLERILHETPTRRRTPLNPNVRSIPRVHGGEPLTGGPKLEIPREWEALDDGETPFRQPQSRTTPEISLNQDHPPLFNGPHFEIPKEEPVAEKPAVEKQTVEKPRPVYAEKPAAMVMEKPAATVVEKPTTTIEEKPNPIEDKPAAYVASPTTTPAAVAPAPISAVPQRILTVNDNVDDQIEHLCAIGLYKSYRKSAVEVPVLRGVDIKIHKGEFLAIEGQSGSGKSTLLHLLGTLDSPDKGEIYFNSRRIDNVPTKNKDIIRNRRIGMIFQFYHLLPELSTLENVLSPLMIAEGVWSYWKNKRKYREMAKSILGLVGLSHRLKHKPRELSGGEMQRAAIARALIAQPELILADEPTGNLDQSTGQDILKILRTLNAEQNLTIVMVTHDQSLARQADRTVRLKGGIVEE
jgi:lipoprotein-releasing system ATP-binding protein